jgi:glycosyltransferase involved in cell wall biosynthesis
LVGEGTQESFLRQYAKDNGFSSKVAFLGYVQNGEALFREYAQADVFVLPSIGAEGVPRVVHEAMAFGCPVVATDVGSTAWQLKGNSGVIVAPGDRDSLLSALVEVIGNRKLREEMAGNARRRALQHSYESQCLSIERFLKQVAPATINA